MAARADSIATDEPPALPAPLNLTVRAAAELGSVRSAIRTWLNRSLPTEHTDEVLLASGEALANALEHGQLPVMIAMEWREDRTLQLRVSDSGSWRLKAEAPTRGLGIPIMTALTDSLTVETTDGTAVRLSRKFTS